MVAPGTVQALRTEADAVVSVEAPSSFLALEHWYEDLAGLAELSTEWSGG